MQEEMHEQMSGYKRMRREHQSALVKVMKEDLMNFFTPFLVEEEGRGCASDHIPRAVTCDFYLFNRFSFICLLA